MTDLLDLFYTILPFKEYAESVLVHCSVPNLSADLCTLDS